MGLRGGDVRIQIDVAGRGEVESTVPFADVESASMGAPPELATAESNWEKGDTAATLKILQPLVENFLGLPVPWVQRATLLLVDAQLETGDTDTAEATLSAFQTAYPDAADLTPLIRAKIVIARKNYIGAKPMLAPIIAEAEQTKLASVAQSVRYGQAFYLMGQIREFEGDYSGALQDYLRTSAIFFEDAKTAERAEERATRLIEEKNAVVP